MHRPKYVKISPSTIPSVEQATGQQLTENSSHQKVFQTSIYKGKISKRELPLPNGQTHISEMESFSILLLQVFEGKTINKTSYDSFFKPQ